MNVILVNVVGYPVGAPFKPNIRYCDEIFSEVDYISQRFAYLSLMFLNLLFLHTGIIVISPLLSCVGFRVSLLHILPAPLPHLHLLPHSGSVT